MFVERVIFIHDSLARSWLFSLPKKTSLTNPRPPPERKHDQRRKRKEKKTDRPSRVADTTEKPKKSAPNGGLVREMGPLISKKNLGLWKIIIWPESLDQLGLIYGWLGWMGWCDVFFLVLFCVSWGCFSLKMWSWICVIFFCCLDWWEVWNEKLENNWDNNDYVYFGSTLFVVLFVGLKLVARSLLSRPLGLQVQM